MKHLNVQSTGETILADEVTPVSLFKVLRDRFPHSVLLESNDYHSKKDAASIIGFHPLITFQAFADKYVISTNNEEKIRKVSSQREIQTALKDFISSIIIKKDAACQDAPIGVIGHTTYDAVQIFEDITFAQKDSNGPLLPLLSYTLYQYQIVINHFNNTMVLICNKTDNTDGSVEEIKRSIKFPKPIETTFSLKGAEISFTAETKHREILQSCKDHIARGDVFQIVPSRRFAQEFQGDDFELYRTLRSVNPSPYLFYLDCGDYRLFGSSPEAQLLIKDGTAEISPIAGTYRRTGDEKSDAALAEKLLKDEKENAEHVMLVDLARNDLNRHCTNVEVKTYREVQFYSHVIHLVSKVTGTLHADTNTIDVFGDTFPAGTLTGAPKYRAMQLIDIHEPVQRVMYGGAVGMFGCDGSCIHAIFIRSFVSQHGILYYQAGSGVVADSSIQSEMDEIGNKLGALKKAMEIHKVGER